MPSSPDTPPPVLAYGRSPRRLQRLVRRLVVCGVVVTLAYGGWRAVPIVVRRVSDFVYLARVERASVGLGECLVAGESRTPSVVSLRPVVLGYVDVGRPLVRRVKLDGRDLVLVVGVATKFTSGTESSAWLTARMYEPVSMLQDLRLIGVGELQVADWDAVLLEDKSRRLEVKAKEVSGVLTFFVDDGVQVRTLMVRTTDGSQVFDCPWPYFLEFDDSAAGSTSRTPLPASRGAGSP